MHATLQSKHHLNQIVLCVTQVLIYPKEIHIIYITPLYTLPQRNMTQRNTYIYLSLWGIHKDPKEI